MNTLFKILKNQNVLPTSLLYFLVLYVVHILTLYDVLLFLSVAYILIFRVH